MGYESVNDAAGAGGVFDLHVPSLKCLNVEVRGDKNPNFYFQTENVPLLEVS